MGRRLPIVWDRAPIHRGAPVKAHLAAGPAAQIELRLLPGFAPDLNPDEGVWHWIKQRLANVSCLDLPQLREAVREAIQQLHRHPELIQSFFIHAGYD